MSRLDETGRIYSQLITRFDADSGVMWYRMDASPRPCFNPVLIGEIAHCHRLVERVNRSAIEQGGECPISFIVGASKSPGVFSLGGDLDLFRTLIGEGDRKGLLDYALSCTALVHAMSSNFGLPMTTISLVQGDALGGGLEAAVGCNVVVAEQRARFGLPEILFNLFPGMGAYSLLARRIGQTRAEKIITSGDIYTAAEFHDLGVVDVLVDDGEGEKAVQEVVQRYSRRRNAYRSLFRVRQRYDPVSHEELEDIARIWVDTALRLSARDLRVMERLARAQDRLSREPAALHRTAPGKGF